MRNEIQPKREDLPSASRVSGLAPYRRRRMTMGRWPCLVAQWMGVEASSPPVTLGLAPFCRCGYICALKAKTGVNRLHLNEVGGNSDTVVNGCPVEDSDVLVISLGDIFLTHLHQVSASTRTHTLTHSPHPHLNLPLQVPVLRRLHQRERVWVKSCPFSLRRWLLRG